MTQSRKHGIPPRARGDLPSERRVAELEAEVVRLKKIAEGLQRQLRQALERVPESQALAVPAAEGDEQASTRSGAESRPARHAGRPERPAAGNLRRLRQVVHEITGGLAKALVSDGSRAKRWIKKLGERRQTGPRPGHADSSTTLPQSELRSDGRVAPLQPVTPSEARPRSGGMDGAVAAAGKPLFVNQRLESLGFGDADLLAFFHAQRTAGSALRHVLARALGAESIFCTQYMDDFVHWKDADPARLAQFRAFAGHSNYVPRNLDRTVFPISLLRHPFYRTVSLYFYCKKYPTHFFHKHTIDKTPLEFYRAARDTQATYFHNTACLRICGKPSFDLARATIEERYLAVGSAELFGDFVTWLLAWMERPHEEAPKAEHDGVRYRQHLEDQAFVDEILAHNQEDEKLFRYFNATAFGIDEALYPWKAPS